MQPPFMQKPRFDPKQIPNGIKNHLSSINIASLYEAVHARGTHKSDGWKEVALGPKILIDYEINQILINIVLLVCTRQF